MKSTPRLSINPASFPFYYGWLLVPLASLGIIMSLPGQTAGFSAFTESLLGITGLSRTNLSLIYMIGTILSGFLLPGMGTLLDKWGSRKMMIFASLMLGFSLYWLSYFDRLALLIDSTPSPIVYSVLLVIGIFSLRFFGQGLLPVTANTMIGKWFVMKRGTAFAILGVFNTVVFSAAPVILAGVVALAGWNGAWRILALIVGVGMSAIAFVFYRNSPEEAGLPVDGLTNSQVATPEGNAMPQVFGLPRSRAIKTRSFWAVVIAISANALVNTGIAFHIQAIGLQSGMSVAKAVSIFIPISFIAVPLSFISAILTKHIHVRFLVYALATGQLVAFISIYFLDTNAGYIMTIIGLGISGGLMGPMQTAVIPKIFGRRYLGSLNGLVGALSVIASALGPILLSAINDAIGSLRSGISFMSVLPLTALFLAFRMPERFEE